MGGKWKFRKGLYREKYQEAVRLRAKFTDLKFRWIPREENEEANEFSREAYERESRQAVSQFPSGFLKFLSQIIDKPPKFRTFKNDLLPPASSPFEEEGALLATLLRPPPAHVMLAFSGVGLQFGLVLLLKN